MCGWVEKPELSNLFGSCTLSSIPGIYHPSNGLCIMKLHELFYNTMVVYTSMHVDTKASNTYLIRFTDGDIFLVVDRNRYRKLHCNRNDDPFSTPPLYTALGTPSAFKTSANP